MMGSHQQMTAREKDIYDTYSEDLERLTFNSKPIINSMTELANDYSSDFAHIIVRCIEDKIKVVPSSQKLPFLYLLDSILKNHKQPYQELLQQNIVSVFTHVFQNIPREQAEKSRLALYKLRCTWTDAYFSQIKLNQLDKKLQTVDPNWPIVPSKRNGSGARSVPPVKGNVRDLQVGNEPAIRAPGQSIHINPAVFARQPSITNSDADKLSLEEQMKKKEQELLELRVKNQQLKIEELQNKLLSGRELTKIEDQQQTAVKRSHQSTSQQDRAKSPVRSISSGVSSTSALNRPPTQGIIIDERKLKDPRMRNRILEQILQKSGVSSAENARSSSPHRDGRSSKSKTPEPRGRTPERPNRSKSKSPGRQAHLSVPATSTTGNSVGGSGTSKSRTPSPVRARQSPTSTSSPRYSDCIKTVAEKKGTTPPPPPRISDDIKGARKNGKKTTRNSKRSRHDSGGKDQSRFLHSEAATDKYKKRKKDTNHKTVEQNTLSTENDNKKSSKISTDSKLHKEPEQKHPKSAQDKDPSSSPSPPPKEGEHKTRNDAKEREGASPGINFKLKGNNPKLRKARNPFRIPKKSKDKRSVGARSPSPNSFTNEGPLVEFNQGRSPAKAAKRQGSKVGSPSKSKKAKPNNEAFGYDANTVYMPLISPTEGWAKIKIEKPDMYRTPMLDGNIPSLDNEGGQEGLRKLSVDFRKNELRNRRGPWMKGGLRDPRANLLPGNNTFPNLAQRNFATGIKQHTTGGAEPHIDHILQDLRNCDPEVVLKQVIPNIVKQGQNLMKDKNISVEQFSEMMKGVFQLKEHAMMQQAERRHNQQQLINPWQDGAIPGENPLIPQHPFSSMADGMTIPISSAPGSNLPIGAIGNTAQQVPLAGGPQPLPGMPPPPPPVPMFAMPGVDQRSINGQAMGQVTVANRDLPFVNEAELSAILDDPVKRIEIDEFPRDIRFYGETALIIMGPEAKDMRELKFKHEFGSPSYRRVIIDKKFIVQLEVASSSYTEFKLDDGVTHKTKIGAPTREIWIDGEGHELYFNKSANIPIGTSIHDVFLEGPAPNVDIGSIPRNDLCAGTVQLIIDGNINTIVTIYLDSKPQVVEIAGKQHILKFVQQLRLLLINGHPFRTEFGGMPMVVYVNQLKHYLRLTALPAGVKLNNVKLWNMEGNIQHQIRNLSPTPNMSQKLNSSQAQPSSPPSTLNINPPSPSMLFNDNSQEALSTAAQSNVAFDRLLNMIPTTPTNLGGGLKMPNQTSESSMKGDDATSHYTSTPVREGSKPMWQKQDEHQHDPHASGEASRTEPAKSVDVHNLWTQLLGAGLVSGSSTVASGSAGGNKPLAIPGLESTTTEEESKDGEQEDKTNTKNGSGKGKSNKKKGKAQKKTNVKETPTVEKNGDNDSHKEIVMKSHHPSIKTRQAAVINLIYDPAALQCKNCGLRFSPSDMVAYSQHLDWHFRLKRREKENAKKAESRRWYFEKIDWIVSDEIEDEKDVEDDLKSRTGSPDEISVVPASSNQEENICPICHEEFDQFYKQDFADSSTAEVVDAKGGFSNIDDGGGRWHLKNAIRPIPQENGGEQDDSMDKYAGRAFHPQCYQDRKNATLNDTSSTSLDPPNNEAISTSNLPAASNENISSEAPNEGVNIKDESIAQDSTEHNVNTETTQNSVSNDMPNTNPIKTDVDENQQITGDAVVKTEQVDNKIDSVAQTVDEPIETHIKRENVEADSSSGMVTMKEDEPTEATDQETKASQIEEEKIQSSGEDASKEQDEAQQKDTNQEKSENVDSTNECDQETNSTTQMDKSLDGNSLMTAPSSTGLGSNLSGGIRINMLPQEATSRIERSESVRSTSESEDGEGDVATRDSDFDPDAIVQPAIPEQLDLKPKLKGRKMVEMPMQRKDDELSGLCSIM